MVHEIKDGTITELPDDDEMPERILRDVIESDNRDLDCTHLILNDDSVLIVDPYELFQNAIANHDEGMEWIEQTPVEDVVTALRLWKKEVTGSTNCTANQARSKRT